MKATRIQFSKFLLGGAVNTGVTYALFVGAGQILSPSAAYTFAYILGIGLSYFINSFFVFRARASLRSALQFPVVYLVQYLTGLILLTILTRLGLDSRIAMLLVIAVNVPLTFVLTRRILKPRPCDPAATE
ncbi:GtrA family protein [Microvirga sp. GCM10011540]|uniref:GtrA family protein n=1 Tax=Microvirga sp. GCM10011540 TaxID=3317338 RepID=UPI00361C58AE